MTSFDHFKENPGFILWNVVNVKRPDENTWEFELIGREKEWTGTARIQKKTLAQVQEGILSLDSPNKKPWSAREDCGLTIVSREAVYQSEVETANANVEYNERYLKNYTDAGLENNVIYKMARSGFEKTRANYEAWKELPQMPLENPINSIEPLKCYFGLPHIVYMHLVGQLCTNI